MSEKFRYTYSAPTEEERREIENIKSQFVPFSKEAKQSEAPQDKSLEMLRSLYKRAILPINVAEIVLYVFGVLLFGFGLTLVLEWENFWFGVPTGTVAIIFLCTLHPIFKHILKRRKKKYAGEIIALCNSLLNYKKDAE